MNFSQRFLVTLSQTKGVGSVSLLRILQRMTLLGISESEFLGLSSASYQEEFGLNSRTAGQLEAQRAQLWREAEATVKQVQQSGIRLLACTEPQYPQPVLQFWTQAPGCLFAYGNLKLLHQPTFCVLSSKNASDEILEEIERVTEQGVLAGEVLVSSHDRPEYQRSAVVPLRFGTPRILVFNRSLQDALGNDLRDEPFKAARLWRFEFDPTQDLAITACPPMVKYQNHRSPERDMLVGALSRRLDFCYVTPGGNMEKIARTALACGRQVRVPLHTGKLGETENLLYERLVAEGARALSSVGAK